MAAAVIAEPMQLQAGARVRLCGLTGAPELNGMTGRLRAFYSEKGRWAVVVAGSSAPKLLKPQNLEAIAAELCDFANVLVDILADDIVVRMLSFLPASALLSVSAASSVLYNRSENGTVLWCELCKALLGEALVKLHKEAWQVEEPAAKLCTSEAGFWRALFRAGYEGKLFHYANAIRSQCVQSSPERSLPEHPDHKSPEYGFSASGHTASALSNGIAVIGGWRPAREEETLYVCAVDYVRMAIVEPSLTSDSSRPSRRLRHSSCTVQWPSGDCNSQEAVLVLGGCHDKTHKPLAGLDTLVLLTFTKPDYSEARWQEEVATGAAPSAIWHHATGSFAGGRKVVVFGGDFPRDDPEFIHIGDRAYASHVYILDVVKRLWQRVTTRGHNPSWRSLHTGVAYTSLKDKSERFIIMGGCENHCPIFTGGMPVSMEGYSLNLNTMRWQRTANGAFQFLPKARMRFAAERYGRHLLVYGGHGEPGVQDEPLLTLNLMTLEWKLAAVDNQPHGFPQTPAAVLAGGCLVGGVKMSARGGVQGVVPKFDFLCLRPPAEMEGNACEAGHT